MQCDFKFVNENSNFFLSLAMRHSYTRRIKGMSFKKFFFIFLNFFFPKSCAICSCYLLGAEEIRLGLCEKCGSSFDFDHSEKCKLCGKPLVSEKDFCLLCRKIEEHSYDRLWTLFPYTGKYRKLLTAYKFGKKTSLAEFLAEKIAQVISGDPVLNGAVIVPVPPRPGKIKESGWDQVEWLVKQLEKREKGRITVCRCLKRRKSKVQKFLGRAERMENLKGRIVSHGSVPKTVLIIDDIITTGSTMEVCAQTLKANGAEKVLGLSLFYD